MEYNYLPVFSLKAIREKAVRYPADKVDDLAIAAIVFEKFLKDKECEHLAVLMIDGQHNMLGISVVTIGGLSGMQTTVRDVFKHAIVHRAHAIILSHNHPSGDTTPSDLDIVFTLQVQKGGKILGCPLLDHIIVSSGLTIGPYFSFNDHKMLGA